MDSAVYKLVELVGSSNLSIEDAIQNAISRADKSLKNLDWFEVIQTRGWIKEGKIQHYQVIVKVGFKVLD